MSIYSYLALDQAGREVKGTVDADNRELAMRAVKQEGKTIIDLNEASAMNRDISVSVLSKKPTARDLAVFCRQFVSIISAGVPVTNALEMLADQTENQKLAGALADCRMGIESGSALADAMREHKDVFPELLITMTQAGEASGSLEVSFTRMAEQFEKNAKLTQTVKKAATYPVVILIVAAIVIGVMLTFVVPQFESLLGELGGEMPAITVFVVGASQFLQNYWYIVLAVIVAAIFGIRAYAKTEAGKSAFSTLSRKLPVVGTLVVKTASARMSRTMSTLMAAGIPMLDALGIVADTMSNLHFRHAIEDCRDDVSMGSTLSDGLRRSLLFPPLVHHMVSIGEETGDIDGMLTTLAEYYEDEVESTTQQLTSLMEPLIIVILAIVVGGIVMSVLMPMMSMYESLGNL